MRGLGPKKITGSGTAERIRKLSGHPIVYQENGLRAFLGSRPRTRWPSNKQFTMVTTKQIRLSFIRPLIVRRPPLSWQGRRTMHHQQAADILLMQPKTQNYCITNNWRARSVWDSIFRIFCHSLRKTTTENAGGYEKRLVYNFKRSCFGRQTQGITIQKQYITPTSYKLNSPNRTGNARKSVTRNLTDTKTISGSNWTEWSSMQGVIRRVTVPVNDVRLA